MEEYNIKKNSPAYSPKDVRDLFELAVKKEDGSIEAVLSNKHKYKSLLELWHASFLAVAINKWQRKKFYLTIPDQQPPDVLFIDENAGEAFQVEVMELFDYGQTYFDGDHERLAKKVIQTKGLFCMPQCHLLLINRINSDTFNISKFSRELKKCTWNFERIWLSLYTASNLSWSFFEVFPSNANNKTLSISVSIKNPDDMHYFY